jgi:hypothetical protein
MAQNSFGSFMQGLATSFKPRAMMGGGDNIDPRLLTVIANAQFQKEKLAQEMAMKEQIANIQAGAVLGKVKQEQFSKYLLDTGITKRLGDVDPKKRAAAEKEFIQAYHNFFSGNIAPNMNEPVEPKEPKKGLDLKWLGDLFGMNSDFKQKKEQYFKENPDAVSYEDPTATKIKGKVKKAFKGADYKNAKVDTSFAETFNPTFQLMNMREENKEK